MKKYIFNHELSTSRNYTISSFSKANENQFVIPSQFKELIHGVGLFSPSELFQLLIKPGRIFSLLLIPRYQLYSLSALLTPIQHPKVALGQCLVEPHCEVVLVGRSCNNVFDLIDDTCPMLDFCQFVYFLVHEKLPYDRYFNEFGEGLYDGMGLVVVHVRDGSIMVEFCVICDGFVLQRFEFFNTDFVFDVAGEKDGSETAKD